MDFTFMTWNFRAGTIARREAAMIDFAGLKPLVKPEHLKVFEFSPSLAVDQVKAGIAHIKSLWGEE
jgi:hypothetical protein